LVAGLGVPIFLAQGLADLLAGRVRTEELAMAGAWIWYKPAIARQTSAAFGTGRGSFHGTRHGWLRHGEFPLEGDEMLTGPHKHCTLLVL
jgi:hypothetical protein